MDRQKTLVHMQEVTKGTWHKNISLIPFFRRRCRHNLREIVRGSWLTKKQKPTQSNILCCFTTVDRDELETIFIVDNQRCTKLDCIDAGELILTKNMWQSNVSRIQNNILCHTILTDVDCSRFCQGMTQIL